MRHSLFTFRFSLFTLLLLLLSATAKAADIYVSPNGSDTADGSKGTPLKTLRMALRQARNLRRLNDSSIDSGITIHVSGTHYLYEPLYVRPEDSGTPSSPTRIVGEDGAALSGGVTINGWKREGKLLVAETPWFNGRPLDFRQLYIGTRKGDRARDVKNFDDMAHILSLDKPQHIIYVPATPAIRRLAKEMPSQNKGNHSTSLSGRMGGAPEMVLHEMWCVANLRIKDIKMMGDSAAVTFHEPESTIQFEHPWPCPMVNTKPFTRDDGKVLNLNSAFYLTGSKVLLDTPGEWHHDAYNHRLYYMPQNADEARRILSGEVSVTAPALETLIQVEGTLDRPVHDVSIEGLTFKHTTWMRPTTDGHVPLQAGMYMLEGYKLRPQTIRPDRNHKLDNQGWLGRPAAAVSVSGAEDIHFRSCQFHQLGSSGLDYVYGTLRGSIEGCSFTEIAGNGIVAGSFSPAALETHLPYNPYDRREICSDLLIVNNTLHDIATEDWGCVAIGCGYVAGTIIAHNDISEVSYSAISLGWGWTQSVNAMHGNEVYRNRISHYAKHMYDCAGIYTLGAQPKTYVLENCVSDIYHPVYAHDPNHWFYLYCDEGSSFITVQDNWTPEEKFLKNANGPGNTWENNGPMVADSIRTNAGISKDLDIKTLRQKLQTRKSK